MFSPLQDHRVLCPLLLHVGEGALQLESEMLHPLSENLGAGQEINVFGAPTSLYITPQDPRLTVTVSGESCLPILS